MLTRLLLTSPRLSLTRTTRFLKFSTKNTSDALGKTVEGFKHTQNTGFGVRAGLRIKELLLSSKSSVYGRLFWAGTSLLSMGALLYYSLHSKCSTDRKDALFWNSVHQSFSNTYQCLFAGLFWIAVTAAVLSRFPNLLHLAKDNKWKNLIIMGLIVLSSGYGTYQKSYKTRAYEKHGDFNAHCMDVGVLSTLLCYLGGPVLIRTAWYAIGITTGLSLTAAYAPSEKFLNWSGPLGMALGAVFAASFGSFFFPPGSSLGSSLASKSAHGALILFSLFLFHDTRRVVQDIRNHEELAARFFDDTDDQKLPEFDAVIAVMRIYLKAFDIFAPTTAAKKIDKK